MDAAKLEELKQAHPEGKLVASTVRSKTCEAFLRPPTRAEVKRFRQQSFDERKRSDAQEMLVRSCVAYPDAQELDAMLEFAPGLTDTWFEVVADLCGLGVKVETRG